MRRTILVTGAAGLLGKWLCRLLAERQHRVIALVKPGSTVKENDQIRFVEADLSSSFSLTDLNNVDTIFHLAQAGGHADFIHSASNISSVTVSALCHLAEFACRTGVKKLIFTSSGGVYGGGPEAFSENALVSGRSLNFYLESKKAAENLLSHFAKHLDTIILRPFFIYGANQRSEMLIPRMKKSIVDRKEIFLAAGQGPFLNPIYVEDAAKALASCIEGDKPKIINIAGNEVISLRKICEVLGEHLGIDPIFVERNDPVISFIGNNALMKTYLHVPETSIIDGLKLV